MQLLCPASPVQRPYPANALLCRSAGSRSSRPPSGQKPPRTGTSVPGAAGHFPLSTPCPRMPQECTRHDAVEKPPPSNRRSRRRRLLAHFLPQTDVVGELCCCRRPFDCRRSSCGLFNRCTRSAVRFTPDHYVVAIIFRYAPYKPLTRAIAGF